MIYFLANYRFRRKKLNATRREAFRDAYQGGQTLRREAKRLPMTNKYDEHTSATIGFTGACLGSISTYQRNHPKHIVGKNQVLVKKGKMFWYGDIDYTREYNSLMRLAERIGPFEIYPERWSLGPKERKGLKPVREVYPYD